MATRLPVVATCVGGNLSIVEDEVSGLLVPPGDTTALAKAITRLIEEPGSAANLAARGQDRIRAEFSMDRMLARIEALYDQALSGRGV
jgi:glycosyltransferase involved in cell wall biosynthesis